MGTVTLRWVEEHLFTGSDSHGHSVVIGRNPQNPDEWAGMKPSDLLLVAVAGCATWDVIEILQKQRVPLRELRVECTGEQGDTPPYTFTSIHNHYIASGAVDPERLEKAIRLSEDKYCSVIATLRPGVPVTSDFEIVP
jgi:putative redox protein